MKLFCILGFVSLAFHVENVSSQNVTTSKGTVTGYIYDNAFVFQGIPYAKPPIGNLRFKPPIPPGNWSSPLSTKAFSPWCMQGVQLDHPNANRSEDCLYLNVFSPSLTPTAKLPVMFWIHGGAFSIGSAAQYPVDGIVQNLVRRDVVVVTINYRLNIFGFYTTAPSGFVGGNIGLLDQILALKWVQTEIGGFGGDSTRVTIFGESAGSASVSLLTYSPLAKGLFAQAIMESGTAYNTWAINGNMDSFYTSSKETTISVNCTNATMWNEQQFPNLISCMQAVPQDILVYYALKDYTYSLVLLKWGPVVDGYVLPDWPRNLAATRTNIPVMLGNNKDETALFVIEKFWTNSLPFNSLSEGLFEVIQRQTFVEPKQFSPDHTKIVTSIMLYKYILEESIPSSSDHLAWARKITQMTSDYTFFPGTVTEAVKWKENGNNQVYLYSFDYESDAFPYPFNYTCSFHSFELFFVFRTMYQHFHNPPYPNWTMSPTDVNISNTFGQLWTDFAKYGNPGMGWQANAGNGLGVMTNYLSINAPAPVMKNCFHCSGAALWNYLIPNIIGSISPTLPPPITTSIMTTKRTTTTTTTTKLPTTKLTTNIHPTSLASPGKYTRSASTAITRPLTIGTYAVRILLEYFDNSAGGGLLYASNRHCDRFWFTGLDQCDMAIKICVEAMPASGSLQSCTTGWVDLGQVTTNRNNASFTTGNYGGWTNPMTYTFHEPSWTGFQTKVIVQDVDSGGRQLIDQLVCQFPGGGSPSGVSGCKHLRPSGYFTYFRLAFQLL